MAGLYNNTNDGSFLYPFGYRFKKNKAYVRYESVSLGGCSGQFDLSKEFDMGQGNIITGLFVKTYNDNACNGLFNIGYFYKYNIIDDKVINSENLQIPSHETNRDKLVSARGQFDKYDDNNIDNNFGLTFIQFKSNWCGDWRFRSIKYLKLGFTNWKTGEYRSYTLLTCDWCDGNTNLGCGNGFTSIGADGPSNLFIYKFTINYGDDTNNEGISGISNVYAYKYNWGNGNSFYNDTIYGKCLLAGLEINDTYNCVINKPFASKPFYIKRRITGKYLSPTSDGNYIMEYIDNPPRAWMFTREGYLKSLDNNKFLNSTTLVNGSKLTLSQDKGSIVKIINGNINIEGTDFCVHVDSLRYAVLWNDCIGSHAKYDFEFF